MFTLHYMGFKLSVLLIDYELLSSCPSIAEIDFISLKPLMDNGGK